MSNPLRRLKFLPWRSLFLLSSLVTLIVVVIDFLFLVGYDLSPALARVINLMYSGSLGVLVQFAGVVGVGVLAVYLLEKFFANITANASVLWALVFCLTLCLVVRSFLPVPARLVNIYNNETQLIAIVIGVFWKGRPYWR
ncbi:peptide chain release factor 1 [cyanobacterium TDX16]|nr:peptide chain release factor 1 [cyanobacterium TDX16]